MSHSLTYSLSDNLKARDASASKNAQSQNTSMILHKLEFITRICTQFQKLQTTRSNTELIKSFYDCYPDIRPSQTCQLIFQSEIFWFLFLIVKLK